MTINPCNTISNPPLPAVPDSNATTKIIQTPNETITFSYNASKVKVNNIEVVWGDSNEFVTVTDLNACSVESYPHASLKLLKVTVSSFHPILNRNDGTFKYERSPSKYDYVYYIDCTDAKQPKAYSYIPEIISKEKVIATDS